MVIYFSVIASWLCVLNEEKVEVDEFVVVATAAAGSKEASTVIRALRDGGIRVLALQSRAVRIFVSKKEVRRAAGLLIRRDEIYGTSVLVNRSSISLVELFRVWKSGRNLAKLHSLVADLNLWSQ